MTYLYLVLLILFTALGQVLYKQYYVTKNRIYFAVAILLFILLPFINYLALKKLPLDVVYINSACIIVTINIISYIVLKEKLNMKQIAGICFIIIGLISYAI